MAAVARGAQGQRVVHEGPKGWKIINKPRWDELYRTADGTQIAWHEKYRAYLWIAATILALGGIGSGITCLKLDVSAGAAYALISIGSLTAVLEIITLIRNRRSQISISYTVASLNVGVDEDYQQVASVREHMKQSGVSLDSFLVARDAFQGKGKGESKGGEKPVGGQLSAAERQRLIAERGPILTRTMAHLTRSADLLCLNESRSMQRRTEPATQENNPLYLREFLPGRQYLSGYDLIDLYETPPPGEPSKRLPRPNSTVVWNEDRFTAIAYAYNKDREDFFVLLEDNISHTTICVGSLHLRGFDLRNPRSDAGDGLVEPPTTPGDTQATNALNIISACPADMYLFGGDYNVTREHHPERLEIFENAGLITDLNDQRPTMVDANTRKLVKLDYIHCGAIPHPFVTTTVTGMELGYSPLEMAERVSDHTPTGATVTLTMLTDRRLCTRVPAAVAVDGQ